jgi:hypothetical protein
MSDEHPLDAENGIKCDGCREIHYALKRHVDQVHPGDHAVIVGMKTGRMVILIALAVGAALGFWFAKV